ncbi:MAG: tyrosine-type recombinase/integrase [Parvibaculum sp.]|uniref:tyrosine-type recombinase/integrase n=1 Tax=Parvibaculum sp. TaxID=2024848 RepID=UPI002ABB75B1|nr:tyrosine-type recombinase/integrase [Parvibaculum sp.]MDZ4382842.1 tyrosine-type recombinase/integrase [Parvibaculum sp.]
MPETPLPYLQIFEDRHGRTRVYYRRHGMRKALPSDLASAAFFTAYAAAHEAAEARQAEVARKRGAEHGPAPSAQRILPFSFAALIRAYKASPEYKRLAATTRAEYDRGLARIEDEDGHRLPRDMRRKDVRERRDARAETPGAANTYVGVLSLLISWGIDADFDERLTVNVCARIGRFKGGSYRAWDAEEKAAFEARWPLGTKQRTAYALARYTGQRRADLVGMTRAHLADGMIQVTQAKTGAPLWIPMHRELRRAIEAMASRDMLLLVNESGAGFDKVYFGAWFAEAIDDAGLPEDCVLHGLRHAAGSDLAEAGCSETEIMSILGHKTARMVTRYTRGARQKQLAKAAIVKLERAGRKRK